jgi:hypothetical protein
MKRPTGIYKILLAFALLSLAYTISAADRKMSREEVLTTFKGYIALNDDFLSSVGQGHGKSGKAYADLRKEVESYVDGPLHDAFPSAQDIVCNRKDKQVLMALFKVVLAAANSADESPAWTLGGMFVCQPSLVEDEMVSLNAADRKQIYDNLELGFENVATTKPKDDERIGQLRKRLAAMAPPISK